MTSTESKDQRRTVTRADVVEAACSLLDDEGAEALTMARVAERVGFTTMAMYRHVRNRQDLVDAAVDHVLHGVSWDELETGTGIDGAIAWMQSVRTCLRAHPWAATLLGSNGSAHPPLRRTVDRLAAQLERSSLRSEDRARALRWVTRVTVGVLVVETAAPLGHADELNDDVLFDDLLEVAREYLTRLADRQPR